MIDGRPDGARHRVEFFTLRLAKHEMDDRTAKATEQLSQTNVAEQYYHSHGVDYQKTGVGTGMTVIRVLEFLQGLPFDNLAIAYIHALRPSSIRATFGETTTDVVSWRVTVYLQEPPDWNSVMNRPTPLIDHIEQEVAVRFACGADLTANLQWRKGGPKPAAPAQVIGHVSGLEKADFL